MKNFDPTLLTFFTKHDISFDYYEHPAVFTVDECEQIKHTIPGAHTKNLFLTDKKGWFYLVSIAAEKRLPINAFRKQIGTKELSFSSPEDLYEKLHLTPGSVSLFWLVYDLPASVKVFLDHDLHTAPLVGRHPNRNDATVTLDQAMREKYLATTGHTVTLLTIDDDAVQLH
jgi:Ala-tRNA(Pro) deacylase